MSDPTPQQITNITSTNQSGNAITAHTVNLGNPKTDAFVSALTAEAAAQKEAQAKRAAEERPTTLFQNGKPVGRAMSFTLDESNGVARFPKITNSSDLVIEQPFEYRSVLLRLTHADTMALRSFNGDGTDDGKTFTGVTCAIVGRTK